MVRNYKKKKEVDDDLEVKIKTAIEEIKNGKSVKRAAEDNNVKYTTLFYRVKKMKTTDGNWINDEVLKFQSKYTVKQVFTQTEELLPVEYIIKCSKINYGLTTKQIRKLAYDYATGCSIEIPPPWNTFLIAGIDWFTGFMTRHVDLAIRKPEKTSLSRATSFNNTNVMNFFDLYERVLQKYPMCGDRINNVDETGVATVLEPP